ncbi:amidophosphoribosyltransferase [Azorhizobium oxalatiphilum]|uniref:Amidophosphoribosyltransferase n=1 Tax=Azorhizobium oxalatiphilum TaxID=980631 RepID=A0A917F3C9_9HYPH|nr:ComF family protein [Azorhizobium oxalatiphilum]GGF45004.1 amidophosphoribosyltransferase [Azorhizobium oxalatiphilum]
MGLRWLERTGTRAGHLARAGGRVLLDLALPPTCISCKGMVTTAGGLCGPCWNGLRHIERPYCERLGIPFAYETPERHLSVEAVTDPPDFDRARAAVLFGPVSQDLVHGLKYGDRLDLALPMARMMARVGSGLLAEAEVLVPVPLHALRLWRRRFNQSALLARHIARMSGTPVALDALTRRKATSSQVSLSRAERRANVAGAFHVPPARAAKIAGRRVVLVDDVFTTGATVAACARTLRRAGAARIDVLTFARVVDAI